MSYLILACDGHDCLRYELELAEAAPMARLLRSLGWIVTILAPIESTP
jgi:hypothetical protein